MEVDKDFHENLKLIAAAMESSKGLQLQRMQHSVQDPKIQAERYAKEFKANPRPRKKRSRAKTV